ncbi:Plasma membrane protein [Phytophthora cinnamomi]|uniref:Plasma membrane protein n=1 Tax=Phytophthora cinnamomi TaxID=4785 RepID=UPI003559918C|nr:Plasma membrane protein [Phytophthora cinnamomi]
MAAAAVKKLSRYCCNNCGGADLYLYCWKGCRHVQNIKTFYAETKSIQQELEMLRVTIYEQEIRFREYELQLKEKHEGLEFLLEQIRRLPSFYPPQLSDDPASIPLSLPSWSTVAAKMVWQQFDGDHDGRLTTEELRQLKDHLRTNHENIDDILPDYPEHPLTARHLLQLYECGEHAKLSDDLRSLGILCGSSQALAQSLATSDTALYRITMESRQLQKERDNFQKEVDESKRAKTRLREVFAASKQSLEDQARDLIRLQQREAHSELQLRLADEKAAADATTLLKAKRELSAAKHALLDLRALVDDQISEKEKWQRYCWELEERLHEASNASYVKERDLWRTKDAKKEESRKNMLLYIEAQKGKRHFERPADPAQTESSKCGVSAVSEMAVHVLSADRDNNKSITSNTGHPSN